jgi:hypothetical protein
MFGLSTNSALDSPPADLIVASSVSNSALAANWTACVPRLVGVSSGSLTVVVIQQPAETFPPGNAPPAALWEV